MPSGEASKEPGALRSALRFRFASLPTRIIVSVFSAALVTGLAVTLISTSSTERFLRSKIDARFPEVLNVASQALDQWYAQRELDIATFASSQTLGASLRRGDADGVEEAERYLAYVRHGFPLFEGLFVLDAQARVVVSVGTPPDFPPERLAEWQGVNRTAVGEVLAAGAGTVQVVSTPLGPSDARIGSLHAMIPTRAITELLGQQDLVEGVGLYVLGRSARVIARSPGARAREGFERPLPDAGARAVVEDYTSTTGEHFVGSALAFDRFGWTLVVEQDYDRAFAPVVSATSKVLAINLGIVVAFGLLAFVIARSITRPIAALSDSARRIALGETDVAIPVVTGRDEIAVLSRALREMVNRLQRNQVELRRSQKQIEQANLELKSANDDLHKNNEILEQLSFTDGLTQLHNHRYFQDRLRIEAKRCDRSGEPLALMLIDIDDFKKLNDQHGHAVGDEVLRRVGAMINNSLRETDLPARYGGEEFAILTPCTDLESATSVAEKVRHVITQARFKGIELDLEDGLTVTVSIGVALYDGCVKRLFNEADQALYRAKAGGKDCVVVFGLE